jgi:hypothetical protein
MNAETEQFLYKHALFISDLVPSSDAGQNQCSLHYIHHQTVHTPSAFLNVSTTLTLDDLRHVSGFRELGSFPIPSNRSSAQNEPILLSSLIVPDNVASQQEFDIDKASIQQLISQLRSTISASQTSASAKLYSIEVMTRVEDAFANGDVEDMVWKWIKPSTPYLPYRPMGWWCSTIDEAVTDWVWTTGAEIQLLMEVVGKEKKKTMFEGGKKPLMIPGSL